MYILHTPPKKKQLRSKSLIEWVVGLQVDGCRSSGCILFEKNESIVYRQLCCENIYNIFFHKEKFNNTTFLKYTLKRL